MTPQATQGVFGGKSHDHPDFSREKQQQSRVFLDVIFYVYVHHVDNRERAGKSD